ncbi:MAG: polysaccharide deacetylase family protein [Clostridia bacterium]|nr:polysaccharide deacetylase family protein [Clostridia bacterium]
MKYLLRKGIKYFVVLLLLASLIFSVAAGGSYAVYTFGVKPNRKLPVYRVEREDDLISISFDCAWGTEYTDAILDALDFYQVKCTFFAVQFWVEKNPEFVKKISERGHEIGTHSATHSHMSTLSESAIIEELESSRKAISEITGKEVTLFRAPFGEYNDTLINAASAMGLQTAQWDVDSLDWKDLSAEQIAGRVISRVRSGSIILCHNNGLHTAESLPLIFTALKEKGFEFRPIGQLIYKDNYEILPDGTQRKVTDNS